MTNRRSFITGLASGALSASMINTRIQAGPLDVSMVNPTVTLFPGGRILMPDGTLLQDSAVDTETSGIKTAINLANLEGYDLHIAGGTGPDNAAVVYQCSETIVFPPMQGKRISTGAITLSFSGFTNTQEPGIVFDSCMMVDFEFCGQVVYWGDGDAVQFAPRNLLPKDDFAQPTIVDSRIYIMTIVHVAYQRLIVDKNSGSYACARFVVDQGQISNNDLSFSEINGGNWGIQVNTPTTQRGFIWNTITCPHVHAQQNTCVRVGHIHNHPQNNQCRENTWRVNCHPNYSVYPWTGYSYGEAGARGVDTYGAYDFWELSVSNSEGVVTDGLIVEPPTAVYNKFIIKHLAGNYSGYTPGNPGSNTFI